MQFGYFDEEKKEYVITRPDTPAPWVNYLDVYKRQRRRRSMRFCLAVC